MLFELEASCKKHLGHTAAELAHDLIQIQRDIHAIFLMRSCGLLRLR